MKNISGLLGAVSLALALPAAPAHAGGDITNFTVRNCGTERIFVCSFDKTDSLMNIPYKARGIQPYDKKEFGCASLNKCKVIIGVSQKKSNKTLSAAVESAMATGAVGAATVSAVSGTAAAATAAGEITLALYFTSATAVAASSTLVALTGLAVGAAAAAITTGGAVAALQIKDGWNDGEVCNQVRKLAQKAGMKPKFFLKDGNTYRVTEKYGADIRRNLFINPDGTAVLGYLVEKDNSSCPKPLVTQLVPN